jgi:hypothetical protein
MAKADSVDPRGRRKMGPHESPVAGVSLARHDQEEEEVEKTSKTPLADVNFGAEFSKPNASERTDVQVELSAVEHAMSWMQLDPDHVMTLPDNRRVPLIVHAHDVLCSTFADVDWEPPKFVCPKPLQQGDALAHVDMQKIRARPPWWAWSSTQLKDELVAAEAMALAVRCATENIRDGAVANEHVITPEKFPGYDVLGFARRRDVDEGGVLDFGGADRVNMLELLLHMHNDLKIYITGQINGKFLYKRSGTKCVTEEVAADFVKRWALRFKLVGLSNCVLVGLSDDNRIRRRFIMFPVEMQLELVLAGRVWVAGGSPITKWVLPSFISDLQQGKMPTRHVAI